MLFLQNVVVLKSILQDTVIHEPSWCKRAAELFTPAVLLSKILWHVE
jgi:hypothetical protein